VVGARGKRARWHRRPRMDMMRAMSRGRRKGPLRRGWTTGACATAAVRAAYDALHTGRFPDPVTISLPKGEQPSFALSRVAFRNGEALAGVLKDAGDDPDVTHGAEVIAAVARAAKGTGVTFRAGPGVGTVTRPGLPVAVGEPAINPAPRAMIAETVRARAHALGGTADVSVTISIPGGEALAAKTSNPRLGIVGGVSILGTTGVVIPYSCSSWIHSIRSGVDVARASNIPHVAAATGRTSEAAVRALHGLAEEATIDMGDFAGGLLKYVRRKPVPRLTIAGGFAKICKLSQGALDLHSSASRVDMAGLADALASLGAPRDVVDEARTANTATQVLDAARAGGLPLAEVIARRAREVALATLAGGTAVDVVVVDRKGAVIGHAGA
jgi:cobalt-precorrin-5B (C1)-methyltransferase